MLLKAIKCQKKGVCFLNVLQLSNQVLLNSEIIFLIFENFTDYKKKIVKHLKTNCNFKIFEDSKLLDENIQSCSVKKLLSQQNKI